MRIRAVAAGLGMALFGAMSPVSAPAANAVEEQPTPPPQCGPGCERIFNESLPYGAQLVGWQDETGLNSVLTYYVDGEPRDVATMDYKAIDDIACGWEGDAQRCTATYDTGAHASGAASMLLTADGGIEVTNDIVGGAAGASLVHLDDNGRADVALRQSTLDPNFAEAPQYWETYLEFEGKFVRTGCTTPQQEMSPAPTEPAHDSCAYAVPETDEDSTTKDGTGAEDGTQQADVQQEAVQAA